MIGTCPLDISCHVHMYLAVYFAFLNGFDFSFLSIISLNVRDEMLEMYSALLLLNYKMPFSLYVMCGCASWTSNKKLFDNLTGKIK